MMNLTPKPKKCKGSGKAIGYGCGVPQILHKFGLCPACFKSWVFDTPEGSKYRESIQIRAKKHVQIESKKEQAKKKEENRKKSYFEKQLETEVNTIVRLIDHDKGCISCTHGWESNFTRQGHAGHRLSVGSNPTLRYHLFNIFLQCSICNDILSANEREYDKGIVRIYGPGMLDFIKSLPGRFPSIHLSIDELKEKIIIARKIIKEIHSGKDFTRTEVNQKLGIYHANNH